MDIYFSEQGISDAKKVKQERLLVRSFKVVAVKQTMFLELGEVYLCVT